MRKFKLILLASATAVIGLITPAFAEMCCPMNYHLDFNPLQCVANGVPQTTVASFPCPAQPPPPSAGPTGWPTKGEGGNFRPPCSNVNLPKASLDRVTDQCLSDLAASAQVFGCLFDDKAEDQKTRLSCPGRQQVLASQCRNRCVAFARSLDTCHGPDQIWQAAFGDISGAFYGSARVDLCGPPLRAGLAVIKRPKRPFKRVMP